MAARRARVGPGRVGQDRRGGTGRMRRSQLGKSVGVADPAGAHVVAPAVEALDEAAAVGGLDHDRVGIGRLAVTVGGGSGADHGAGDKADANPRRDTAPARARLRLVAAVASVAANADAAISAAG